MYKHRLDLVTAPTIQPITVDDVKGHLRITEVDDYESDVLTNLIKVATSSAESFTGRSFITQTWKMFIDKFPTKRSGKWWDGTKELPITDVVGTDNFELPKAPLQSVTHIKTYDDSDVATTFSSASYYVSAYSGDFAEPGKITLRSGNSWPLHERLADGIEIQFVCGYGDAASDIPWQIKQALLHEIAHLYEHRTDCGQSMSSDVAKRLLQQFKVYNL